MSPYLDPYTHQDVSNKGSLSPPPRGLRTDLRVQWEMYAQDNDQKTYSQKVSRACSLPKLGEGMSPACICSKDKKDGFVSFPVYSTSLNSLNVDYLWA